MISRLFNLVCLLCFVIFPFAPAMAVETPGLVITPDIQFSYAQQLFKKQDYITAQVEFKRFLHFFSRDFRVNEAQFKIAMSLYYSQQFHEAAKLFNKIILENNEDRYTWESYFMQSKAFLAMGKSGYAKVVLQNYLKLTDDLGSKDQIYLELARINIRETMNLGTDNLNLAKDYLTLISPAKQEDKDVADQIEAIRQVRSLPKKSPALSGILAIIPGGGFLYCERYKDAFVTFCLNAGLMYAAYEAFNHDNPALGGVITFVEAGFYAGNIYGSISAAHKHNKARQIEIFSQKFNLGASIDPMNKSYLLTFNHAF